MPETSLYDTSSPKGRCPFGFDRKKGPAAVITPQVNPAIRPRMMSIAPFGGEAEETPSSGAAPPTPPQPDGAGFETAGSDSPLPPRRDNAAHQNEPDPGGRLRPTWRKSAGA